MEQAVLLMLETMKMQIYVLIGLAALSGAALVAGIISLIRIRELRIEIEQMLESASKALREEDRSCDKLPYCPKENPISDCVSFGTADCPLEAERGDI